MLCRHSWIYKTKSANPVVEPASIRVLCIMLKGKLLLYCYYDEKKRGNPSSLYCVDPFLWVRLFCRFSSSRFFPLGFFLFSFNGTEGVVTSYIFWLDLFFFSFLPFVAIIEIDHLLHTKFLLIKHNKPLFRSFNLPED